MMARMFHVEQLVVGARRQRVPVSPITMVIAIMVTRWLLKIIVFHRTIVVHRGALWL